MDGPTTATVDDRVRYTADVSPSDLPPSRVVWTVDGRVVANRSATAPDAASLRTDFDEPGRHTVEATVVDAVGQTASDGRSVQVQSRPERPPDEPGNGSESPDEEPSDQPNTPPTGRTVRTTVRPVGRAGPPTTATGRRTT